MEKEPASGSFKYALLMLLVYAVLGGVLTLAFGQPPEFALIMLLVYYVTGLISTIVVGAWFHLLVLAFGGRGAGQSFKAILYGSTPSYLLGWLASVPFYGKYLRLLFILWGFVLYWIGIRKLHLMGPARAAALVVVAVVVGFAIMVGFYLLLLTSVLPRIFTLAGA